ncbi:MAG: flavin reductase family protein [Gemmatimonadaceae bacterium]|nr:flavin reductase family protein [Gemmatimonadaceae bacterium]
MLDKDSFRAALGRFASGITVVTTRDATGRDVGMTISAFCSVSLSPPLVLVSVAHNASMYQAMAQADHFAVNILADTQEPLSRRFAAKDADRFDGVGFTRGRTGVALLDDVVTWIECRRVAMHEAGDHTLVIGETLSMATSDARPLLYYRGGYATLER